MKVYGELMEHGEVVPHLKVEDDGDELARRFISPASVREALEEHAWEATRRAAVTRSPPMKTFEPGTLCFFYRHTTQANERKRQCEDDFWDPQL